MTRIFALLLAAVLLVGMFTACRAPADDLMLDVTPNPVGNVVLSEVDSAAVTDFAVRLFQTAAETDENTLISPLSVLVALSMTANGAVGETLSQMESVLGMPVADLNVWIHTYTEGLPEAEQYKLSLANSVWFTDEDSFTVSPDFLQVNADCYGAGIYRAPFDDTTCKQINGWVEDKTDGMIRDILDRIPEDAVMYLVNALAFDAEWESVYTKNEIGNNQFTAASGQTREVEMMYAYENRYLETENAAGFIKYYKDKKYAFAALLPNEGVALADLISSLTGEELSALLSAPQTVTVETAIPKFETEYDVEMSEVLIAIGMPNAFDGNTADFSKLGHSTEGNICISRVLHKTYISVDERGTKAGAATVVEMDTESAAEPPADLKRVYLNRPFLYMLIDTETNLPFFIGTVNDMEG